MPLPPPSATPNPGEGSASPSVSATATSPAPSTEPATATAIASAPAEPFVLTSPAFRDGGAIPKELTCDGPGRSPELRWSGVPSGATALVLEVIDVDAGNFVHWLVLDLPAASTGLLPAGVGTGGGAPQQGTNSFGQVGWGGPCPPSGTHRYVFTLLALATPLGLTGHPTLAAVERSIGPGNVLGRARLTGTYRRG